MSSWPGCQGKFFTKEAVFCWKNTLQPCLGTQTLFHMYCKWIKEEFWLGLLYFIFTRMKEIMKEKFYLEGKMYHKGCPARHSDPLNNLENINSSSLSKNSITNCYVVATFLEKGNPSICTVVFITLFSLIDDIYELPHTQEPPFYDTPSVRKFQITWKTFSEKLAENTADRMLLHGSFALTTSFFLEEEREKASEV